MRGQAKNWNEFKLKKRNIGRGGIGVCNYKTKLTL